ncbi:unnamed protein product [Mytilus coruscus]|uniref:Uncharacterized protein n=1 Tax=Mytilus coruscus TaxID=42192 RepID=A0A6J8D5S5_MYTCO|nr:unnamed protein product [Mytilus coruscus]
MDDINPRRQTDRQNEASTCPLHEYRSMSAQSLVTSKSFYQTLRGYFATTKIFVYPDIEIVQEGDKIGFITYTGGEGRSKIKIKNRTEFNAYFGYVADVSRNSRKRDSNQKPTLHFSNKSCQTDTDNLDCEFLKMNDQWSHFTPKGDNYSFIEGYPKHEGPFYRGVSVEIKSQSIKKFMFNGHTSLLESVTFATPDSLQERDTCILFSWRNDLYSPSTIRKIIKDNETDADNFDIILFSDRKGQLRFEILSDVFNDTAFQVAKNLQNLKDGCKVRKLKDVLPESEERAVQLSDFCKNMNTQQKRKFKIERKTRQNVNIDTLHGQTSEDMEELNIDELYNYSQVPENNRKLICIQKNLISKNRQKMDLSMKNNYCEKHLLEKTKTKVPSHRIIPTKMKNSKVKTQTMHPEWKIYLQHGEDQLRNLVSDYFGDDMIRQAVYGMLEPDVDRRFKASFERPNVPWPSMHPLLPYKLRFLDEDEDHNHTLSDHFTGDLYTQQKDDNSMVTEQVDSCEQSDCSNVEIDDGNHFDMTSSDENDNDCDQSN